MSILTCSRKGCQNIMCDRHSYDDYICNECFEELVQNENISIDDFMNSEKGNNRLDEKSERCEWLSKIFSIDEEN